MSARYIVIIGHAVGNERDGFRITHEWDGRWFALMAPAVSHGFELAESDDFNIGVVENGRLAGLLWMDERIDATPESLAEIGTEIGLAP